MVSEVSRSLGSSRASLAADDKASPWGGSQQGGSGYGGRFFLRDLPDELQFDMNLPDGNPGASRGHRIRTSVGFGNRVYERTGYWRAIADAVNGREAASNHTPPKRLLTCKFARKETDGRITLELEEPRLREAREMSDAALQNPVRFQSKIVGIPAVPSRLVRLQGGRTGGINSIDFWQ